MLELTVGILAASIILNLYLGNKIQKQKKRQATYDCNELLSDLLAGQSLVKVTRLAPTEHFIRSPRGQ